MNIQEPARNIPVIHEVDLCFLSLLRTDGNMTIIAGLIQETTDRLAKRGALAPAPTRGGDDLT